MTLTQSQIDSFNAYQQAGIVHPFTCGNHSDHAVPFKLVPEEALKEVEHQRDCLLEVVKVLTR